MFMKIDFHGMLTQRVSLLLLPFIPDWEFLAHCKYLETCPVSSRRAHSHVHFSSQFVSSTQLSNTELVGQGKIKLHGLQIPICSLQSCFQYKLSGLISQ